MDIEKKALYNLLRMNWLCDPSLEVEDWQVEDYRVTPFPNLFQNLSNYGIALDKRSFQAYADPIDTPEELTDVLLDDIETDSKQEDHLYLLVFELWRRLLPEKPSLSIFCDELDHRIFLYDQEANPAIMESMQDALASLQVIMDENTDQGLSPQEVFKLVSANCANDLETFLYDYVAEQIDNKNTVYALELFEGCHEYLKGNKWFELLRIRLFEASDSQATQASLVKLMQKTAKEEDLPFYFELLSLVVQEGEQEIFRKMVHKIVPLLQTEEDFQDLLVLCGDYYRCLDEDRNEQFILSILDKRLNRSPEDFLRKDDPDLVDFVHNYIR